MKVIAIEEDVNGCGESAQVPIQFEHQLSEVQLEEFATLLAEVKRNASDSECFDTEDFVQAALDMFGQKGTIIAEFFTTVTF